jgi:hypothetical protein
MLHAHCYVDTTGIPDATMLHTKEPIPCGAIEELSEIRIVLPAKDGSFVEFSKQAPRLLAVNLKGHGCILIAKDVEIFNELRKHKDNCFVHRPVPEAVNK